MVWFQGELQLQSRKAPNQIMNLHILLICGGSWIKQEQCSQAEAGNPSTRRQYHADAPSKSKTCIALLSTGGFKLKLFSPGGSS